MKWYIRSSEDIPQSAKPRLLNSDGSYNLKELKFYYKDHIDSDKYPTFFHWMEHLRKTGQY